ncbi:hypothetical protein D3C76_1297040 [compost metagenome]
MHLSHFSISLSFKTTPVIAPASIFMSVTAEFSLILTLFFKASFLKLFIISLESSLTGNTLSPLSILVSTPKSLKKAITSLLSNFEKLLRMNLLFLTKFFSKVSKSPLNVRLHLPFPVILSLFPTLPVFSTIVTSLPSLAEITAASIPAAPPPITITFIILHHLSYFL